jgi:Tol biopolymer transport system component
MKKLTFITVSLLIVVVGLPSCKKEYYKEYYCEDCIGNNHPPIAVAGPDTFITLPRDSILLDGSKSSDPDGKISEWQWTKITGPASFTIVSAATAITTVKNLKVGVYQFELKVTDAGGLFSKDTIQVTVVNHPTPCEICKIVFVSDRDGNPEIYSCNPDGSNISRLTNNAATDDQPAWSPDGSHIAFVSDRTGANPEIYIMNADGSNVVSRTFSGNYIQNPAWSPDGMRVAYSAPSNGSIDIWMVGETSGSPSLLYEARGTNFQPSWSPDGTKIALVSAVNHNDLFLVYDIFTINSDGTNAVSLTDDIFDQTDYMHPSWSPSGTKLAVAIIKGATTLVGVMNVDGSGITAITSGPGAAFRTKTSWSPDGTRIAYTSLSGSRSDISWVSADGSASGTIVTNGWNADWQH